MRLRMEKNDATNRTNTIKTPSHLSFFRELCLTMSTQIRPSATAEKNPNGNIPSSQKCPHLDKTNIIAKQMHNPVHC